MADIVNLDDYRNKGNGAREALIEILGESLGEVEVDLILAELWRCGFKVVPLE